MEEVSVADHLWTLAFSLIMITSILGNSIVLWIVLGEELMPIFQTNTKARCLLLMTIKKKLKWKNMITIFLSPPRFKSRIKKFLFILIVVVLAIGGRGHGTLREVQYIIKKLFGQRDKYRVV